MKWKNLRTLILGLLSIGGIAAQAQTDNFLAQGSASPYLTLGRGLIWGGTGLGTVGQNFIFHPLDPNQGFCLFVFNNNPTSAHNFTATIAQTGDPAVQSYAGNTAKWTTVLNNVTFPVSVAPHTLLAINYKTSASAGIVVSFTNNVAAGGSPDSADIFTVQTNQNTCGASIPVQQVEGVYPNNSSSLGTVFPVIIGGLQGGEAQALTIGQSQGILLDSPRTVGTAGYLGSGAFTLTSLQAVPAASTGTGEVTMIFPVLSMGAISTTSNGGNQFIPGYVIDNINDAMQQVASVAGQPASWDITVNATNPAAGAVLINDLLAATANVNVKWNFLRISCSATCEIQIHRSSSVGTGCSNLPLTNMDLYGGVRPGLNASHTITGGCTVQPTLDTDSMADVILSAGVPYQIDLKGAFNQKQTGGSISGMGVENVSAVTGQVIVTLQEVETAP